MILANHGIISSSGASFDADALAFITSASITDNTQKTAVNTLITDLKNANIWTKMKAIYPFVGGSATSHKYNLKDPRDLDAAYRLEFFGGWTHDSNGATPNGTNGYADTRLFAADNLTINSVSYSLYIRGSQVSSGIDFGYFYNSSSFVSNMMSANQSSGGYGFRANSYSVMGGNSASPIGFYNANRTTSANFNMFKDGTKISTLSSDTTGKAMINYKFYLGALFLDGFIAGNYSNNNYAFAHISDGLTDSEAIALRNAVQTLNTTLGRQV